MRKFLVIAVFAFVTVAMLAPPVLAQAPAGKVTITGLFDQVTSATRNVQDSNFARGSDHEWYATTRFRPDFTFELGRTKAVMGLEIDVTYGSTNACGGGPGKNVGNAAAEAQCTPSAANNVGGVVHPGDTAAGGLNTDVTGIIEMKWMYTEFDLTGKDSLLPFIPVPTVARLGLQPFSSLANYKVAYANGDFAGISGVMTFAPNLKLALAYVMVEDELAGGNRDFTVVGTKPSRGNDFAIIISPEYTVYKGLDIKPLYSLFYAEGTTSGAARRSAFDPNLPGGTTNSAALFGSDRFANGSPSSHEARNTIGVDASYRLGPFGLDPTIYYQVGTRDVVITRTGTSERAETKMSSWLIDLIGSYQMGPLLLEARGVYSTGNKARDNLGKRISYFEPIDLDTSYYNTWSSITGLGVDYKSGCSVGTLGMCTNVGYDRYGRLEGSVRATYAVTPALSAFVVLNVIGTAEKVDTDMNSTRTAFVGSSAQEGDSRYLGTESGIGLQWKFAPNVAFDWTGFYLATGKALDSNEVLNGVVTRKKADDAYLTSARVRFSF